MPLSITGIRRVCALALIAVLALGARAAAAQPVAELALVLAIDVSASVNDAEYALQRHGTAAAFRDAQVQAAVARAPGGIAVCVVQWASVKYQRLALSWVRLTTPASMDAFADVVAGMERKLPGGGTMIHAGLAFAATMFRTSPVLARRRTIDLAANGTADDMKGLARVREQLVGEGIVINGLAIEELGDDLTGFFREHVIGGPGAFVVTAWSFEDFQRAMRIKLLREIQRPMSRRGPEQNGDGDARQARATAQ